MDILKLTNIISPELANKTYVCINNIFGIMFKSKKNRSVTIRFNNVIKELQIGVLKGVGYKFYPIYTIDNIENIDNKIPIELHSIFTELFKYIDMICNICFSSRKKVAYFGFYKKEQQMILNTKSNVKIKPAYIYDRLLYN